MVVVVVVIPNKHFMTLNQDAGLRHSEIGAKGGDSNLKPSCSSGPAGWAGAPQGLRKTLAPPRPSGPVFGVPSDGPRSRAEMTSEMCPERSEGGRRGREGEEGRIS